MKVLSTRVGLGPIHNLPRAVAHRWPALAVATVAAALPMAVVFAAGPTSFPDGIIAGSSQFTPGPGQNGIAVTAGGNDGTVTGVSAQGITGVEAEGSDIGISAGGQHVAIRALGIATDSLGVDAEGTVDAVRAQSAFGIGVEANGGVAGVKATSFNGPGVQATSTNGAGVQATSISGNAMLAQASTTAGSFAAGVQAVGDEAVVARGTSLGVDATANGTAVAGVSSNEVGGLFGGKEAPIRMLAASTAGAPSSGLHHRGELYVDSKGLLFYCTTDGTPGTWKKVVLQ